MAGPDQNRHLIWTKLIKTTAALLKRFDLIANPSGLFFSIPMPDQTQLFTFVKIGPKLFAQPPCIA